VKIGMQEECYVTTKAGRSWIYAAVTLRMAKIDGKPPKAKKRQGRISL
jgi:hypothetical protein